MIIEGILNRWRGTGKIVGPVSGTNIYSLYFVIVVGLLTNNWIYGVIAGLLFMLGESAGWGKWVGALCYPERKLANLEKEYADHEGRGWPFIHWIANFFIREKEDFIGYCTVALTLRGFYWWIWLYGFLFYIGLINNISAILAVILLGLAFPLACHLSKKYTIYKSFKYLSISGRWETQELYYGFIQGICFWVVIFYNVL